MPTPGEHKTVQARNLAYAQELGWAVVPREEAERRRGFNAEAHGSERARNASLFFDDLLDAQVRSFNPRYTDAPGALPAQLRLFLGGLTAEVRFRIHHGDALRSGRDKAGAASIDRLNSSAGMRLGA